MKSVVVPARMASSVTRLQNPSICRMDVSCKCISWHHTTVPDVTRHSSFQKLRPVKAAGSSVSSADDCACIDVRHCAPRLHHPSSLADSRSNTQSFMLYLCHLTAINSATLVVIQIPDSASKGRCWRRSHPTERRTCCSTETSEKTHQEVSPTKMLYKFANLVCGHGFIQASLRLMKYRHNARIAVRLEVQS